MKKKKRKNRKKERGKKKKEKKKKSKNNRITKKKKHVQNIRRVLLRSHPCLKIAKEESSNEKEIQETTYL